VDDAARMSRKTRATFLITSSDEKKLVAPPAVDLSKWVIGKTARIDEQYTMGQPIGTPGQFGQAFLVKHKATGEQRVVKVVSKQKFHSDKSRIDHYEQLRNEINIMRKAKHANIIHFFEVFESAANLYIIMECCSGGELFDHIQARGLYSEQDATVVLRQIIEGIKYLHDQRIAHCDLKPDNFLFLSKETAAKLKIIDFGMSKHVERGTFLTKFRGTPYYVAPEVLTGKYSEHCDIWSFGVVMFVCLFGYPPFHANSNNEIFDKIEAGFQPVTKPGYGPWFPATIPCSADAKDLIAKCLNSDIARRLTATEVLEHKWFHGGASGELIMDVVMKNLHSFVTSNQFKMEVLALMVDVMGKDELKGLAQMFAEIDINGDGLITPDELVIAFKKQGIDDEKVLARVKELMKSADTDGDGALSYNELLLASVQKKLAAKEERLWQAFCKFDKDLDGTITEDEIAQVLSISPAEAKALLLEVDANGDGVVDFEEFSKMMVKKEEAELGDVKVQRKPQEATSSTLAVPK
jgi:calcium-dependent protein kinase